MTRTTALRTPAARTTALPSKRFRRIALALGGAVTATALVLGGGSVASAQSDAVKDKTGDATTKGGIPGKHTVDAASASITWIKGKRSETLGRKTDVTIAVTFAKPYVDQSANEGFDIALDVKGVPGEFRVRQGQVEPQGDYQGTAIYTKSGGAWVQLTGELCTVFATGSLIEYKGGYRTKKQNFRFDAACLRADGKKPERIGAKVKVLHYVTATKYSIDTVRATKNVTKG